MFTDQFKQKKLITFLHVSYVDFDLKYTYPIIRKEYNTLYVYKKKKTFINVYHLSPLKQNNTLRYITLPSFFLFRFHLKQKTKEFT